MRGKHHSPVLKETLKLASEKSNLGPCGPVAGRRQLKPNCFLWNCIRLWLLHFVPVSGDGCSNPSATTSWLGCSRERSCEDVLADREMVPACTSWDPTLPSLPSLLQSSLLSLSQQSSHSLALPCSITVSLCPCLQRTWPFPLFAGKIRGQAFIPMLCLWAANSELHR